MYSKVRTSNKSRLDYHIDILRLLIQLHLHERGVWCVGRLVLWSGNRSNHCSRSVIRLMVLSIGNFACWIHETRTGSGRISSSSGEQLIPIHETVICKNYISSESDSVAMAPAVILFVNEIPRYCNEKVDDISLFSIQAVGNLFS